MTTLLPGETLAASLAEKVSETWQKINTRRNQQEAITPGWVLQSLGLKPGSTELRRAIFELVRRIPYQLGAWNGGKRAARTVLTGMCYSFGNATRQGSSSLTRFIGQSAITSSTWRR